MCGPNLAETKHYDPGMHGLNWEAVRDKYLPLVKRVTTRLELNDLIGMVVGELSALHISVRGGDLRRGTTEDQLQKEIRTKESIEEGDFVLVDIALID